MILAAWEFRVREGCEAEFERHYAGAGTWAQLFARSPGFQGTTLMRDAHDRGRYLLTDAWTDRPAFDAFRASHGEEYDALDRRCEALTEQERCLGWFEPVERAS